MTKEYLISFLGLLIFIISQSSCVEDDCKELQIVPIYKNTFVDLATYRNNPLEFISDYKLKTPGKIYFYDKFIFINELKEGVHVYDNTNPSNPLNIGFVKIAGNVDISIKNDVLYADNYNDLVAIDISVITKPKILSRETNVFNNYPVLNKDSIIDGFTIEYDTVETNCNNTFYYGIIEGDRELSTTNINKGEVNGIAGSLSRFSQFDNYLYAIDGSKIRVFDISNVNKISKVNTIQSNWGIETLYTNGNNLFIGANNGLYIYDLTIKSSPQLINQFVHARACDPVIVQDSIAFVTVRSGNNCGGNSNQLLVIDLVNIQKPKLILSYDMINPHGLSVSGSYDMIVCEGKDGFKIMNYNSVVKNVKTIYHLTNHSSNDVIWYDLSHFMIIGDDGLYQYEYSNGSTPKLISTIVKPKST